MEPIQTVPYYLVLLLPAARYHDGEAHFPAHVAFIDEMSAANVVLLGGDLDTPVDGADAAYLLRAASPEEAERWAARDPLVVAQVYTPRIVAWHLVGVTPGAIDPRLLES